MMNALPSFTEALKGVQTWTLHYHRTGSIETTWNQLPVRIAATIQTGLENAVMEDVHIMRAASEMPWCLEHADEILKLLNTMAQSVHPSSITLIRAGSIWLDIMAPAIVIHQWR